MRWLKCIQSFQAPPRQSTRSTLLLSWAPTLTTQYTLHSWWHSKKYGQVAATTPQSGCTTGPLTTWSQVIRLNTNMRLLLRHALLNIFHKFQGYKKMQKDLSSIYGSVFLWINVMKFKVRGNWAKHTNQYRSLGYVISLAASVTVGISEFIKQIQK